MKIKILTLLLLWIGAPPLGHSTSTLSTEPPTPVVKKESSAEVESPPSAVVQKQKKSSSKTKTPTSVGQKQKEVEQALPSAVVPPLEESSEQAPPSAVAQKQEEEVLTTDSVLQKPSGPSWFSSSADTRHKWAIFPNYERNTTYGHIFGARVFAYPVEDTGYYTALQASVSEELFWDTTFSYKYWKKNRDQFDFIALYNGFNEPYYGEGMDTQPSDREDIPIHKGHLRLEYVYRIIAFLYGGMFFQFDYRAEKLQAKKFPNELVASIGGLVRYDSRDNLFNPQKGEYYQARVWLNSHLTSPLFLDGEVRLFFSLMKNAVLALRGMAGITLLNTSSHLFRFSLGGPYLLRGYALNRFRGEHYWLSQVELRHTPWKWITLTGFFDIGAIWDEKPLPPPRFGFGGSLRLGLPPDYNKKIRIEIGKGGEKYNFTISFNHPF